MHMSALSNMSNWHGVVGHYGTWVNEQGGRGGGGIPLCCCYCYCFMLLLISHCASTITHEQQENYTTATYIYIYINCSIFFMIISLLITVVTVLCCCCYSSVVGHAQWQLKHNNNMKQSVLVVATVSHCAILHPQLQMNNKNMTQQQQQ